MLERRIPNKLTLVKILSLYFHCKIDLHMRNGILEPNSRNSKSASLSWSDAEGLNQVGDVHRHLINGGVVELLDVSHQANVIVCNKVYSYSLSAKSATASNPKRKKN